MTRLIFSCFYNGSNKFLKEAWVIVKETRPEVMQEIDDKTFDMGSIVVLICHDHYRAIPEGLYAISV